jgi:hypothetical protein
MGHMAHPETHENQLIYLWARAKAGTHMRTLALIFEAVSHAPYGAPGNGRTFVRWKM